MAGRISLVAHRGQPLSFPENSLEGFRHCLDAGAGYLETDVHITADGIPVLSHDANLLKLTDRQLIVADHPYDAFADLPAGYPQRFGDRFAHCRIATLAQFADLLRDWPDVTCFIELKGSALSCFGTRAVDLTIEALAPIIDQCVLISFEYEALAHAQQNHALPIGWVLPAWSEQNRARAQALSPDYLFVDDDICPREQAAIWRGDWTWGAYTINDANLLEHYAGIGIELLETNRYSELAGESELIEQSHDF